MRLTLSSFAQAFKMNAVILVGDVTTIYTVVVITRSQMART